MSVFRQKTVYFLSVISLVFFILSQVIPSRQAKDLKIEMVRASQIMSSAASALKDCRSQRGIPIDPSADINQTGLVGKRFSPITTSLGNLQAKRTTTNPNFGGLLVFLLKKAKVETGDVIAVGASGSFPALVVAVLSAAQAMNLTPLVITSLGASQWGANHPDFHWLYMHRCLLENEIFPFPLAGVSMGGEKDRGKDMQEEGRALLNADLKESGIPLVAEKNLVETVEAKMRLYSQSAGVREIKAFVNIGGSWSNLGSDSLVLHLKPGLVKINQFPDKKRRGVLYEMAVRNIPVIHLLNMKGLVQRYGLEWDPEPLPAPGKGKMYRKIQVSQTSFLFIALTYLLVVCILLFVESRSSLRGTES